MKWISSINRQSVLPILLGISLTTFGLSVAILLYTMLEKNDDDRKKYDRKNQVATSKHKEVSIQFRIPEKYVSAVIGKGGTVIKNIEELTNTRIKMEKEDTLSSERVCYVRSDNMENIHSAQNMIHGIIQNLPVIETYELFLPFEAAGKVFKKSNGFAQEIQKSYGAKVICENNAHEIANGLKRRIILKGTAEQIAPAVIQIEDKVQEEVEALAQLKMQFPSIHTPRIFRDPKDANVININKSSDSGIFDYFLPYETCQTIMEKDGCVQEIERSSGAKIVYDETVKCEDKERKVIIRGTPKQVKLAYNLMKEVYDSLELKCSEDVAIKKISDSSSCNNDSSTSNNILNPILQQDGLMDVYVSAMKTPNLFWIQVIGPANIDLQHLIHEMTEYYDNEKNREIHALKKITEGQMVAAKFPYDGRWYRAEVIAIVNSTMCQVCYVDYGDVEIISKHYIFELRTDMLSLRQQAVECSLANVKPQEDTWNIKVTEKFAELVHLAKWKPLVAKVKGYKERSINDEESRRQSSLILCIDLYDKVTNKNIGDELIRLGMAQIEEEICPTVTSELSHDK